MRHQRDISGIIAAHVGQRIAEALAAGIMLLEVGEAAIERVAARVDDLRVGQDQADQAGMGPIVRHLVDEEGLVRSCAGCGCARDIPRRARGAPPGRGRRGSPDRRLRPLPPRAAAPAPGCRAAPSSLRPAEWLARICSTRVDPARGMPRMKIGSGAAQPRPGARGEEGRGEQRLRAGDEAGRPRRRRSRSSRRAAGCLPHNGRRTWRSPCAPHRPGRARNGGGSGPPRPSPSRASAASIAATSASANGTVFRLARLHQTSPSDGARSSARR